MVEDNSASEPASTATTSLDAAADLIRTLDEAFAEMSTYAASAAEDAEEARKNARAANEVARRYKHRTYKNYSGSSSTNKMKDYINYVTTGTSPKQKMENHFFQKSPNKSPPPASPRKKPIPPPPPSPNGVKKHVPKIIPPPPPRHEDKPQCQKNTSSDSLAQSHAEDVLSLSLELEKTKEELKNTRFQLKESKQKKENERMVQDLQVQLQEAQQRIVAAEQDAQTALDIAESNAQEKHNVEQFLQQALQEMQHLRDQPPVPALAMIAEEEEEEETPVPRTPPSKSMILAGRDLVRRISAPETESSNSYLVHLARRSAQKRKQLRQRLLQDEDRFSPQKTENQLALQPQPNFTNAAAAQISQSIISRLRESGEKLQLQGCYFQNNHSQQQLLTNGSSSTKITTTLSKNDNAEEMVQQYCNSVEQTMKKYQDEIRELKAFCEYLEKRVVTSNPSKISVNDNLV